MCLTFFLVGTSLFLNCGGVGQAKDGSQGIVGVKQPEALQSKCSCFTRAAAWCSIIPSPCCTIVGTSHSQTASVGVVVSS